jgi:RNA polymerase sigma-70 factor (ECF subfamily)
MGQADFEALWRAHYGSVVRTALVVIGNVEEAKDVAQEAFARAYQHWSRVSRLDRPESWVHRVATNLAISSARRKRPPPVQPPAPIDPPEPPDERLAALVESLTPSQRAVIALRFYLDWSVEDVARTLGKRPGTVTALTHQALERLRPQMSEEPRDG